MWRDVVAVKRLFKDMQISVKSEMSRMQTHIVSASRDVANAVGGVSVAHQQSQQSDEAVQLLADRANAELRQQIAELRGQYAEGRHELQERDHRLQSLLGDLKVIKTHYYLYYLKQIMFCILRLLRIVAHKPKTRQFR